MATIALSSLEANIRKSVNAFVSTNIEAGLSLQVIYPRGPREGALEIQWMEFALIQLAEQTPIVKTGSAKRGALMDYLLSINCFEQTEDYRSSGQTTLYTLDALTDSICGLFTPGSVIPILDYEDVGKPQVGTFISLSFPSKTDVPTPADSRLYQKNISATIRHLTEFNE